MYKIFLTAVLVVLFFVILKYPFYSKCVFVFVELRPYPLLWARQEGGVFNLK